VWENLLRILRLSTCGVTVVTRTTTTRLIAEQLPSSNNRKMARFEAKAGARKKSFSVLFLFQIS
jgi:hypothetical protein